MKTKELTIVPPEGYEIDKENSTLEKIVFKEVKNELPKSFYDLKEINGYYVSTISETHSIICVLSDEEAKNVFPTKEEAEACLALSQLCQLRDAYNGEPLKNWCDWRDEHQNKFVIFPASGIITKERYWSSNKILSFKTPELRDEFLNNFKDLIETAKPLL